MSKIKKAVKTLLIIISVLIRSVTVLPTISTILRDRAKHLAEKNNCVLQNNLDFKGLSSQQYKCEDNNQLEQNINSYIKQSYS